MDYSIPPSYVEATNREWLPLVASYLNSTSLCCATLVSTKWHQNLIPWLWGDPASHFGTEGDRVYVALTRFKRTLSRARIEVRQLTHTLHLPPAQTELYDRPQHQWLRDVLDRLPNLQCLVVSEIPFFDHSALLALRTSSLATDDTPLDGPPVFPLRLLIASQCNNCIPASLGPAFAHFPNLTFLDLSYTPAARDENVLISIGQLHQLQILKLRRIGLRDSNLEILANVLNPRKLGRPITRHAYRLRSLDLRDNSLTDQSVKFIITRLIHEDRDIHSLRHIYDRQPPEGDWPQSLPSTTARINDRLREPELDEHFIRALTQPKEGILYLEDLDRLGLTHLYLANNLISVEAIVDLVKTKNLHVLDAGNLDTVRMNLRSKSLSDPARLALNNNASFVHGAEKLTHPLEDYGGENLTYLRINHTVVTASAGKVVQDCIELDTAESQIPDLHEMHGESSSKKPVELQSQEILELQGEAPAYELSAEGLWCAELPVSPVNNKDRFTKQNGNDKIPVLPAYQLEEPSSLPEVVPDIQFPSNSPINTSTIPKASGNGQISRLDASFEIPRLIGKRQEHRHGIRNEQRGLLPGRIPAMQALVLTEVPGLTRSTSLVQNLKDFITDCARENHLAMEQARLEEYLGQIHESSRGEAIRARAKELFALQTIVLELAPQRSGEPSEADVPPSPSSSPTISSPISKLKTLSAVDDRDVESFWEAAKNDFSFFDDEECGVPASDTNRNFPMSSLSEKFSLDEDMSDSEGALLSPRDPREMQQPLRDVVAEIARWRTEKRRQHQAASHGTFVPGFWPGEVKIIRQNLRNPQGSLDYYGNRSEKGVYR